VSRIQPIRLGLHPGAIVHAPGENECELLPCGAHSPLNYEGAKLCGESIKMDDKNGRKGTALGASVFTAPGKPMAGDRTKPFGEPLQQ
jgi:hypothetical protein